MEEVEILAWIREDDLPASPGLFHQLGLAAGVAGEVAGPLLACVAAWPLVADTTQRLVRGGPGSAVQLMDTAIPAGVVAVLGLFAGLTALAWGIRALLDHLGTDHGAAELARARLMASASRVRPGEDGVGLLFAGDGCLATAPLRTPLTWMVLLLVAAGVMIPAVRASGTFVTEFLDLSVALWLLPALAVAAWTTTRLTPLAALVIGSLGSLAVYAFLGLANLGWAAPGPELVLAGLPLVLVIPSLFRPLMGTPAIRLGPGGIQHVVLRSGRVVPQEDPWVPARIRLLPGPRGPVWEAHHADGRRDRYRPIDGEAEVLRAALEEVGLVVHVVGLGRRTRLTDELGESPGLRLGLPLAGALLLGLAAGEWTRRQAVLATEVVPVLGEASDLWSLEGVDLDRPARARQRGLDGVASGDALALVSVARGDLDAARVAVDAAREVARSLPIWGEGSATWAAASREGGGPQAALSELTLLAHLDLEMEPWRSYGSAPPRPGEPADPEARRVLRAALFALDPGQSVGGVRSSSRSTARRLAEALGRDPDLWQARVTLTLRDLAAPHLLLDRSRASGMLGEGSGPAAAEALLLRTREALRGRAARARALARHPGWEALAEVVGEDLPATIAREVWGSLARARLAGGDPKAWAGVARGLAGRWSLHSSAGPRKKLVFPDGSVSFYRAQSLEVLRTALMDEAGFPTSFAEFLGRIEEPAAWRSPIRLGPFAAEDWLGSDERFWATSKRAGFRSKDIPEGARRGELPPAAREAGFGVDP